MNIDRQTLIMGIAAIAILFFIMNQNKAAENLRMLQSWKPS